MNLSEFRKDLSNQFNQAMRGEKVIIERGGLSYQLIADGIMPKVTLPPDTMIVASTDIAQSKENFDKGNFFQLKAVKTSDPTKQALCKIHGTPLDFRGRCLQKGCKYA